jgi:hypothetical protein
MKDMRWLIPYWFPEPGLFKTITSSKSAIFEVLPLTRQSLYLHVFAKKHPGQKKMM